MYSQLIIFLFVCFYSAHFGAANPCEERGPCPDGQICRLQQVLCVTSPCPPVAICVDIVHNDVCDINYPVLSSDKTELFCGRGPNRVTCPDHTKCKIQRGDKYAVCCYTGPDEQQPISQIKLL